MVRPYDTSTLLNNQPILDEETGKPKYPLRVWDEILRAFGPSVTTYRGVPEQIESTQKGMKRLKSEVFRRKLANPKKQEAYRHSLP